MRDGSEIAFLRGCWWFKARSGSRPRQESLKVSPLACRPFRVVSGLNAITLHDFNHSGTPTECVLCTDGISLVLILDRDASP